MNQIPIFCTPVCDPIFDCPKCIDAMEDAALKSAANMGTPECYYCGGCGTRFAQKFLRNFEYHIKKCEGFSVNS